MKNVIALCLALFFALDAMAETELLDHQVQIENASKDDNPDSYKALESVQEPKDDSIFLDDYPSQSASFVKNVYLESLTPTSDILYVHQVVALELKMLIFSEYTTIETSFEIPNALKNSVEVLNPKENWVLNPEDSSFKNIFFLKINQPQFAIPSISVHINTKEGVVSETLEGYTGHAIRLERKGSFAQVVAENLEILETKITSYDINQNLAVFQLKSTMGNLFDFHLESYKQQGIESKSGNYKEAVAFYYVIVPKTQNTISFDYFNTKNAKYQTLSVQNIASENRVSTQSDLKPKNNIQFFKIALLIFLVLLCFALYLYKRKWIFILLGLFAFVVLVYVLSLKTSVRLKSAVALRIMPTFNATIVLTTKEEQNAEILGVRGNYYKVILDDEHIGWVLKNDVKN